MLNEKFNSSASAVYRGWKKQRVFCLLPQVKQFGTFFTTTGVMCSMRINCEEKIIRVLLILEVYRLQGIWFFKMRYPGNFKTDVAARAREVASQIAESRFMHSQGFAWHGTLTRSRIRFPCMQKDKKRNMSMHTDLGRFTQLHSICALFKGSSSKALYALDAVLYGRQETVAALNKNNRKRERRVF